MSFRGTQADSLRNWITDLKLSKMTPYQNYTGVQVHTGFQQAYMALKVVHCLNATSSLRRDQCLILSRAG